MKTMIPLISCLALFGLSNAASADWQNEMATLRVDAQKGEPRSQGILASLSRTATASVNGTPALELAKYSADSNHPFGLYALGRFYGTGSGIPRDEQKAEACYERAVQELLRLAESGDAWAQLFVASCLDGGFGVQKNQKEAAGWYRKAAEQGNAEAQAKLGACYILGRGVKESEKAALAWCRKSAEQGHADAQRLLAVIYSEATGPERDQAVVWLRKAAEQGNAPAQLNLGLRYSKGQGVERNPQKAAEWLRLAIASSEDESSDLATQAKACLNSPELAAVSCKIEAEIVKTVSDPDTGKYGGPSTHDVIALISLENVPNTESGRISGGNSSPVDGIRRGEPLVAELLEGVPSGKKIFPVRITTKVGDIAKQADFYFYRDEFGDWSAVPKPKAPVEVRLSAVTGS